MTKRYHPDFNADNPIRTVAHFNGDGNLRMMDDGRPNAARFDKDDADNDADADAFFDVLMGLLSGAPGQQPGNDGDHILICSGDPEPYDASARRPHVTKPVMAG